MQKEITHNAIMLKNASMNNEKFRTCVNVKLTKVETREYMFNWCYLFMKLMFNFMNRHYKDADSTLETNE